MDDWAPTPASEVDAITGGIAEPLLLAGGFRPGSRRRWVRSFPPVRHLFELAPMKGATLVPRWGVSLDFVPHVRGKALAWHRTDKSAAMDLVYDPVDFDAQWADRWGISTLHGGKGVRRDAERVLPAAVRSARVWLDGARDLASVFERAEWLRTADRPGRRFTFDSYVQQPLAYALLLARSGSHDEAHRMLDAWIAKHSQQLLRDKLCELLKR